MPDGTVPLPNNLLTPVSNIVPLLVTLIILIILSGFFSSTETAYSCANKIRIRALATNGNKRAQKVLVLAEDKFDKLISTILVGNNIVNLTAATISTLIFERLLNGMANYSLVSTIVITLAVLIFGEVIPKFVAKVYPEKIAFLYYPLILFFYYLFFPINQAFSGLKFIVGKIFRLKQDDVVTEDEIMTVVEEAEEDGTLKEEETKLIRSVIEFDDLEVGDILVPRVNMTCVEVTDSLEDIKDVFKKEGYSRLPVFRDSIDTVIGTIHEKDFFNAYLAKKEGIGDILQPALYTTEHVKISKLLKQLQKKRVHMAIVLDEYGGTMGLVTLEDILEELVGEIWDEHDEEINYFTDIDETSCIVDGNTPLSDVFEKYDIDFDDSEYDANTLSGFIIEYLGEIPRVNKKFAYKNLQFEILKSTIKRVLSVKITKLPNEEE